MAGAAFPETIPSPLLVPYHQDPLPLLAELIIHRHTADLSQVVILLPQCLQASRLRRCLLHAARQRQCSALLGPRITTLRQWAERHSADTSVLSRHAAELMLAEALLQHPTLLGDDQPWRLVDSVLQLFDELTLHAVHLPAELEQFTQQLLTAYGMSSSTAGLSREARLVHTLWHAWHEQLHAQETHDASSAYLATLGASLSAAGSAAETHFYLLASLELMPAEIAWATALVRQGRLTWVCHGLPGDAVDSADYHPDAPLKDFLINADIKYKSNIYDDNLTLLINCIYNPEASALKARAEAYAAQQPVSPAQDRLRLLHAGDAEQEAQAIALQVRRWLLAGVCRIGIVAQDRRLARRVRALLERAEVAVQDHAGWALSTTSAASVLERWLQTVEEDFAALPLLDVLKSPFVCAGQERVEWLAATYRFEQDVVQHENIGRNLARYRKHLGYRQARLPANLAAASRAVAGLLDRIEHAATPLLLFQTGKSHRPEDLLNAVEESLHRLGIVAAWATDAAGQSVLRELRSLRQALPGRSLRMRWPDFRAWLGGGLERANFIPTVSDERVQILTLQQTACAHFDALVIAGVDAANWPGPVDTSPYFNSAVRHELALPTAHITRTLRFHHFRRLLQSAPAVLLTVCREQQGQPVQPSPWLELLQTFHQLAYRQSLEDHTLVAMLQDRRSEVFCADTAELPVPLRYPQPKVPATLLPATLSAHAYQQMIDCPYQFLAARCLGLKPVEALRERLEKSDYGERIHRILSAFHRGQRGLPGPFGEALTPVTRGSAEKLLGEISRAVFAQDLEDNFEHRGWLNQWLATLPHYLDWQTERTQHWRVADCEIELQRSWPELDIKGRIDRIDHGDDGCAVLDYKTGAILPSQNDIESGEAIQLPFYALLAQEHERPVTHVAYVAIGNEKVSTAAQLGGTTLDQLTQATAERLHQIMQDLRSGQPLPAWGDEKACRYCAMTGLCRKQMWLSEPP
ncbi:MAG: PD-(D/E)XK nuclease family protein [Gammaproteobacteria bacterium]|nr:PD-(D/E)XK nuclease family protein [Gammaproteobacteria bacterium]